jgi:thiamine-monophosphate kinase
MKSEDSLIARVVRTIPSITSREGQSSRVGIGDDAAVLKQATGLEWVLSCDAFIEGVHFLATAHPADSVGYKCLARATSDLAAMGATPRFFLLTLAVPSNRTSGWLSNFLKGMSRAARELGLRLAGGDTTCGEKVALSITVIGQVAPGHALTRAGARPGDLIYVSGILGAAKLGLDLVLTGVGGKSRYARLTQTHLCPKIQVQLGCWLSTHRIASAAMDISDGLSTDLYRLTSSSGVGAIIQADRVPTVRLSDRLKRQIEKRLKVTLNPLEMALHGGDDYVLLFTVPPRHEKRLARFRGAQEPTCIGEITRGRQVLLADSSGKTRPLRPDGWDPFRR